MDFPFYIISYKLIYRFGRIATRAKLHSLSFSDHSTRNRCGRLPAALLSATQVRYKQSAGESGAYKFVQNFGGFTINSYLTGLYLTEK